MNSLPDESLSDDFALANLSSASDDEAPVLEQ